MAKIVINPGLVTKLGGEKKKTPILRPYYRPFFFGAVPASILTVIFTAVFYQYLPPLVPIFNTMDQVNERLADKEMIWLLPGLAVAINVIAALVIFLGRKYEVTLLQIFDYLTIFIQVLLLAVLLRTILVII